MASSISMGHCLLFGVIDTNTSSQNLLSSLFFSTHHTLVLQIWSMKKNEDAAAKKRPKTSAAELRVQKGECINSLVYELWLLSIVNWLWSFIYLSMTWLLSYRIDLTELDLPSTMALLHPDPAKKLDFELTIKPDEGAWTWQIMSCSLSYSSDCRPSLILCAHMLTVHCPLSTYQHYRHQYCSKLVRTLLQACTRVVLSSSPSIFLKNTHTKPRKWNVYPR